MIQTLTPQYWHDYELIDCGDFEKLERFGKYILIRPEPQAVWSKKYAPNDWQHLAHARFEQNTSASGVWNKTKPMPDNWEITYQSPQLNLKFRLALTAFKHIGIFPEQAANWEYIYQSIKTIQKQQPNTQPKVLNLFAYTGGASLAARAAGADTIHLDSIKQVVGWARQNMELSSLDNIRWLIEDAHKFVQREAKRGNVYQGIILDPPAYGLGPNRERWKLEEQLNEMLQNVRTITDPKHHFVLLNTYSLGFSSLILNNLFGNLFPKQDFETGELFLQSQSKLQLPLGVFARKCL
jgi:23S rRNA (cytosine1962-C5)-methyltransferase